MQALAASCEELRARTGKPPLLPFPTIDLRLRLAYIANLHMDGMVWHGKTLFKHASLDQRELLFMRGV